jgi:peptide/nickel transport system substrate-binding protein
VTRAGALALAAAIVLAGCSPTPTPDEAGRTLRIGILGDESTLQPYTYVTGYPGWPLLMLVYDTLFLTDDANVPLPWLATADRISADGRTHTLTLRADVTWHDGRPLTSADVAFTVRFYQTHHYPRWTRAVRDIVGVETPDSTTAVLTIAAPDAGFTLRMLADVPMLPAHVWRTVGDPKSFADHTGSGPYRLVEYVPDRFYRFAANPTYFAGRPAVDTLIVPIMKTPAATVAALLAGELQATAQEIAPELVVQFERRPGMKVARGAGFGTTLLQFNAGRAPWDDARLRQVIASAIDTAALCDVILLGSCVPGRGGWRHPASPWPLAAVTARVTPATARAQLDALGYRDRDGDGRREANGTPLAPELLVQANRPDRLRAAELVKARLREIGIDVTVRALEPGSLDARVWPDFDVSRGRDFDWTLWGWSAPMQVDPFRVAGLLHSDPALGPNNIGGYRSGEADALAARLQDSADPAGVRQVLEALEHLIARERPFEVLWYADLAYAYDATAYDGWTFQQGQGILHKRSFLPGGRGGGTSR